MKIVTWNLMRPTYRTESRNTLFLSEIKNLEADIVVLTETNSIVSLGKPYFSLSSLPLPSTFEELKYFPGENRVSIFSKFPLGRQFETADPYTSICTELITPQGNLIVYGTIIGVTGGKNERFVKEIEDQKEDIRRIINYGNVCVVGDYNISFSGYPYPSEQTAEKFKDFLTQQSLNILTSEIANIPDHIAISAAFPLKLKSPAEVKIFPKSVTDHSLISLELVQP